MEKITFLINGTISGEPRIRRNILKEFSGAEGLEIQSSDHAGHLAELAAAAVKAGQKYIVTVGGDGSINETVNGIMSALKIADGKGADGYDYEALKEIRFGVLPAGTGNDYARSFGWENDIFRLKNSCMRDKHKLVDMGWASSFTDDQKPIERFFMNITDVGMGGDTVRHMAYKRIPLLGSNLNYMKAILSAFVLYEKSRVRWTSESETWEGNIMSLVIANGKFFGSGLCIAPDAIQDDGKFSVVTLADITMMDYLMNMRKVKAGEFLDHPQVSYHQASSIFIESLEGKELPIDMDGDFGGFCPMNIRCLHQVLPVMM